MGGLQAPLPTLAECLTQNGRSPRPHPPYSPDLALSYFFRFPWWQEVLKGEHFAAVEEVKHKMAETLKDLKTDEFKNCFEQGMKVLIVYCTK